MNKPGIYRAELKIPLFELFIETTDAWLIPAVYALLTAGVGAAIYMLKTL